MDEQVVTTGEDKLKRIREETPPVGKEKLSRVRWTSKERNYKQMPRDFKSPKMRLEHAKVRDGKYYIPPHEQSAIEFMTGDTFYEFDRRVVRHHGLEAAYLLAKLKEFEATVKLRGKLRAGQFSVERSVIKIATGFSYRKQKKLEKRLVKYGYLKIKQGVTGLLYKTME